MTKSRHARLPAIARTTVTQSQEQPTRKSQKQEGSKVNPRKNLVEWSHDILWSPTRVLAAFGAKKDLKRLKSKVKVNPKKFNSEFFCQTMYESVILKNMNNVKKRASKRWKTKSELQNYTKPQIDRKLTSSPIGAAGLLLRWRGRQPLGVYRWYFFFFCWFWVIRMQGTYLTCILRPIQAQTCKKYNKASLDQTFLWKFQEHQKWWEVENTYMNHGENSSRWWK